MFLCNSAKKQEVKVSIFSEVDNCSAKSFADKFYLGNFSKLHSLDNFINSVDLITVETENIPLKILHYIEKKTLTKFKCNFNCTGQNEGKNIY